MVCDTNALQGFGEFRRPGDPRRCLLQSPHHGLHHPTERRARARISRREICSAVATNGGYQCMHGRRKPSRARQGPSIAVRLRRKMPLSSQLHGARPACPIHTGAFFVRGQPVAFKGYVEDAHNRSPFSSTLGDSVLLALILAPTGQHGRLIPRSLCSSLLAEAQLLVVKIPRAAGGCPLSTTQPSRGFRSLLHHNGLVNTRRLRLAGKPQVHSRTRCHEITPSPPDTLRRTARQVPIDPRHTHPGTDQGELLIVKRYQNTFTKKTSTMTTSSHSEISDPWSEPSWSGGSLPSFGPCSRSC